MEKKNRKIKMFTSEQLDQLQRICEARYETDEICLFVLMMLVTELRPRHLLGSFNTDVERRKQVLKDEFDLPAGTLLEKKHHAYLRQFKRKVKKWIGVEDASFEMIVRAQKWIKKEEAVRLRNIKKEAVKKRNE